MKQLLLTLAVIATVPFTLVKNQIVVQTSVNGKGPYSFLVDTGVTPSVIDRAAAEAAGVAIDQSRSGEASGAGSGTMIVQRAPIQELTLSGVSFRNLDALAADLSRLSSRLGQPLHGILGDNFFAGRVVTIDYAAQRITIGRSLPPLPPGAIEMPFSTANDDVIPIIQDFEINGQKIPVSLDTGASLAVELYPAAVERLGLAAVVEKAAGGSITGARGDAAVRKAKIDALTIGGMPLNDVEVTFSTRADHGAARMGNIGNALMKNFVVTFDYTTRRVRLEK
ncbi:MAG TPA: retroviral-like aspartic protease family protein [Thermoanaerobaculia bacterium]|nr:retroviral-like aspartic protease family protein [Thermoanaerobaculia bacterium]